MKWFTNESSIFSYSNAHLIDFLHTDVMSGRQYFWVFNENNMYYQLDGVYIIFEKKLVY